MQPKIFCWPAHSKHGLCQHLQIAVGLYIEVNIKRTGGLPVPGEIEVEVTAFTETLNYAVLTPGQPAQLWCKAA